MKVVFVSHVSNKYGAGRSLLSFIDGLLQKEVQCYVIMPKEGPMVEELKNRGVEYSIIPFRGWTSSSKNHFKKILRAGFNLLISLVIAIKAYFWKADIIYTNSSVTPVGAFAAFFLRKPHIWHIREFGEEDYKLSFDFGNEWSMKLMDLLSFRIIVISEALKQKYAQHISTKKIQRVYNPVQLPDKSFKGLNIVQNTYEQKVPILVIMGGLHPGKGQIDAVLAITDLTKQGIQTKLIIVGGGDPKYLKQLKQSTIQNNIADYVNFTGYLDNPYPIMNSANIALVCSLSEAFGRVTVESMLLKKPVIATRSGATPELIKEGFDGLLYEPGNHSELAEKIRYLIEHPQEAKQMGENGFKEASTKYTIEKCAGEIFHILQKALRNKRGKRR